MLLPGTWTGGSTTAMSSSTWQDESDKSNLAEVSAQEKKSMVGLRDLFSVETAAAQGTDP